MSQDENCELQTSVSRVYSLQEIGGIAQYFADSGLFKGINKAAAFVKILAGQELGIGPMQAMSQLHIMEGKLSLDATLVGAQIKRSGRYNYEIEESNDKVCIIRFYERDKFLGASSFSIDDARTAGLASRTNWIKYPKDMLRSRAMTKGARTYCPDVFNGSIYAPEELDKDAVAEEREQKRLSEIEIVDAVDLQKIDPEPQHWASGITSTLATGVHHDSFSSPAPTVSTQSEEQSSPVTVEDHFIVKVQEVRGLLGITAESSQQQKSDAFRFIGRALNLQSPPTKWKDLTIDQLNSFIDKYNEVPLVET